MDNPMSEEEEIVVVFRVGPLHGKGFRIKFEDFYESGISGFGRVIPVKIDDESKNLSITETTMRDGVLTVTEYSWTDQEPNFTIDPEIKIVDM